MILAASALKSSALSHCFDENRFIALRSFVISRYSSISLPPLSPPLYLPFLSLFLSPLLPTLLPRLFSALFDFL